MFFTKSSAVALGGLVAMSQAHMLMLNPTPYQEPTGTDPKGPIEAGANRPFPCKLTQYIGTATEMAKGSPQNLRVKGSAVHGGGSCQISLTYDNPPTKDSVWKVIHSIHGGCPARGVPGNLEGGPDLITPGTGYDFTIPEDIPTGNATLAWSWLNKVGNREFYMNCAPISITGSEGSESALEALPDMFVANVPDVTSCKTEEGIDIEFPNPGNSVEVNAEGSKFGPPPASCPAGNPGTGSGNTGGNSPASSAPAATQPAATQPAATASVAAPAASSAAAAPVAGGAAGRMDPGTPCTPEGAANCISEGGAFSQQRCASGLWSIVQPLPAGTECTPGIALGRRMVKTFRA